MRGVPRLRSKFVDRMRPVRVRPMLWPLAFELARGDPDAGIPASPIACAIVADSFGEFDCVVVDADGVLFSVCRGEKREVQRFALDRALRIHASIGELVEALLSGPCIGWVHGFGLGPCWLWERR